jgi:ubiquinone biosynthesis protein COQ4
MTTSLPLPRFDLLRAGRALAALLRNPDDLPQVFTLIDAVSGTAPHRLFFGFKTRASGKRLLRDRPDIVPMLADKTALRALPDGSLGRAYLVFIESENISPEGIRDASEASDATRFRSPELEYIRCRMRDTHDLWHALTGFRGDVLGELALLAFSLPQHWNSAVALIVVAGVLKGFGHADTRVIFDAIRRGGKAGWLPALEWESLLPLPLEEVRARLGVVAAPTYQAMRMDDLRAVGLV